MVSTSRRPSHLFALAPAKLNLFLELHAKRPDGYHELETVMIGISRYDQLRVQRRQDAEIVVRSRWCPSTAVWQQRLGLPDDAALQVPSGPGNLAHRILDRFRQEFDVRDGFEVQIFKAIPAGAGMGGASSDAATALRAAASLCGVSCRHPKLWQIAAECGSDVPFFLGAGMHPCRAALARGRGERLQPAAVGGDLHFVVGFPPQPLSTAAVYAHCSIPADPRPVQPLLEALAGGGAARLASQIFNRLADPAARLSPWVHRMLQTMRRLGLHGCQLTGSGSACLAIAANRRTATRAAAQIAARRLGIAMAVRGVRLPMAIPFCNQ